MSEKPLYQITQVNKDQPTRTARSVAEWLGYLTPGELETLQEVFANFIDQFELATSETDQGLRDCVVVKIGAGAGTDSLGILEVTNNVVIFSVDIACGEDPISTNEHLRLEEAGYGQTGHVVRIWGDSKIVGKRWPIPVDFLVIDGDHTAAGVRGDIAVWVHHVRAGGVMVFHDYGRDVWPDVKSAVDELVAGENECLAHTKTLIAFRKAG